MSMKSHLGMKSQFKGWSTGRVVSGVPPHCHRWHGRRTPCRIETGMSSWGGEGPSRQGCCFHTCWSKLVCGVTGQICPSCLLLSVRLGNPFFDGSHCTGGLVLLMCSGYKFHLLKMFRLLQLHRHNTCKYMYYKATNISWQRSSWQW